MQSRAHTVRSAFSLEEKEKSLHRFFAFFRSTNGNQKMVFPHTPHNVCSSLAPSFITAFFTPQSLSLSLVFRTDSSGSSSSLSAFWVLSQRSRADFKASHCSLLDRKQRRTQCQCRWPPRSFILYKDRCFVIASAKEAPAFRLHRFAKCFIQTTMGLSFHTQ